MAADLSADVWSRFVRRIDPEFTLLRVWPLTGGVSAAITALEIAQPGGGPIRLVARRHGARDRARNPRIARDEFRLMQIARAHGIAAPAPCFLDESCEIVPDPVVVVACIDGMPLFMPPDLHRFIAQSAAQLAAIHQVSAGPEIAFLPSLSLEPGPPPANPDIAMNEDRIRAALAMVPIANAGNTPVLLHGDYWPGNILWNEGALVAVIDWEDAATGDPLADLANMRLELLWALGHDAMHDFTAAYRALSDVDDTNLPVWDLRAALKPCGRLASWGLDPDTERRMRERHHQFVEQALAAISGS